MWRKVLAGSALAGLVVLGMPTGAWAGENDPFFTSVPSTSFAAQPATYSVTVVNNLQNTSMSASISGSGLSAGMKCVKAGADQTGLGTWRCSLSGRRLNPGTATVTARASGPGGTSKSVSRSINVASVFAITGHSSPTEGQGFTVRGRYDRNSSSSYRVSARVTSGGRVVGGQSGKSCGASSGTFTCNLQSVVGSGSSYTVTVTESGRTTKSASTTVAVTVVPDDSPPSAPTFSGPSTFRVEKQTGKLNGNAGRPGVTVQVLVDPPAGTRNWASPSSSCSSSGSGSFSCKLPKLAAGQHTFVARSYLQSDPSKISAESVRAVNLVAKAATPTKKPTKKPTVTPTPTPEVTPTPEAVPEPESFQPLPSLPTSYTGLSKQLSELLALLILALAVSTLARPGPLSLAWSGNSSAFATDEDVEAGIELAQRRGIGIGDNSPTWRALGHDATDYWSRTMPGVLHRYSPFASRLASDGVDLRAMFGSLWWLFPIGGGALGLAAASNTGGHAVVPSVGIVIAAMVLACFDAFAGFVASVLFGLLVIGDAVRDKHGALTVIAIAFLWTALPLIASAIRPFRRPGVVTLRYTWDRLADVVIPALLCGWVAQKIAQTMDLFAGTSTGIPAHANQIGLLAVAAIAVRVLLANAVDVWWPERLRQTEIQEDLPAPTTLAILSGIVVRTAVFAFLGEAFIGTCWQWYVGVALFALPDLLLVVRDWFALSWSLKLPVPIGVTKIFLIVVGCTLLVAVAVNGADDERSALRFAFLAAALIPAVLGGASVFRAEKTERPGSTWDLQLAGAGLLLTTVILGLHGWNY